MLTRLRASLPRPVKKFARAALHPFTKPVDFTNKQDMEFYWQQTEWLHLWKRSEVKARCLEYWKGYRHLDEIRARFSLTEESNILDVGCGLSSVLHYLRGRRIGLDPLAARYGQIYLYPFEVVAAAGENIPFRDEFFDTVFCSNCIDHTSAPTKVMQEVLRVLRTAGHLILTCEIFPSDVGARSAAHPHSMTVERFLALPVGFKRLEHWASPWYGLKRYALRGQPTGHEEHILLLQKER